jgi:hypothetical protein
MSKSVSHFPEIGRSSIFDFGRRLIKTSSFITVGAGRRTAPIRQQKPFEGLLLTLI